MGIGRKKKKHLKLGWATRNKCNMFCALVAGSKTKGMADVTAALFWKTRIGRPFL